MKSALHCLISENVTKWQHLQKKEELCLSRSRTRTKGMDTYLHLLLTSALQGRGPPHVPAALSLTKSCWYPSNRMRWVKPTANLDVLEDRINPYACLDSNPESTIP
jgi:hypothetical protein